MSSAYSNQTLQLPEDCSRVSHMKGVGSTVVVMTYCDVDAISLLAVGDFRQRRVQHLTESIEAVISLGLLVRCAGGRGRCEGVDVSLEPLGVALLDGTAGQLDAGLSVSRILLVVGKRVHGDAVGVDKDDNATSDVFIGESIIGVESGDLVDTGVSGCLDTARIARAHTRKRPCVGTTRCADDSDKGKVATLS